RAVGIRQSRFDLFFSQFRSESGRFGPKLSARTGKIMFGLALCLGAKPGGRCFRVAKRLLAIRDGTLADLFEHAASGFLQRGFLRSVLGPDRVGFAASLLGRG